MTFNGWTAEMPIELCKAALLNAPVMTWSQACILPMQWYDFKDPFTEYDIKSCIIYPEWKAAF